MLDSTSIGVSTGRKAKQLIPIKFEEMLNVSPEKVRKDLNITPVREGPVSWYQDPVIRDAGLH